MTVSSWRPAGVITGQGGVGWGGVRPLCHWSKDRPCSEAGRGPVQCKAEAVLASGQTGRGLWGTITSDNITVTQQQQQQQQQQQH